MSTSLFPSVDTHRYYASLAPEARLEVIRRHVEFVVDNMERDAEAFAKLTEQGNLYALGYVAGFGKARMLISLIDMVLRTDAPTPEETVHGEP